MAVDLRTLPVTTVTTANTAVKLPAAPHAVKVYISAGASAVVVGDSTVTATTGIPIAPNTTLVLFADAELISVDKLYINSATANATVTVAYLTKVS